MWKNSVVFLSFSLVLVIFCINSMNNNDVMFELFLENSRPHIGADYPIQIGANGEGIKIGVIDTGVNFQHPDLIDIGGNGKISGGYDFIENDKNPQDTNGHGTQVAGIIAADGEITGIAPKSKIFAYRVSEDGEAVLVVYIPTAPNPTSGNMAFVSPDDVMDTHISVEDAMKLIFSGGTVLPSGWEKQVKSRLKKFPRSG